MQPVVERHDARLFDCLKGDAAPKRAAMLPSHDAPDGAVLDEWRQRLAVRHVRGDDVVDYDLDKVPAICYVRGATTTTQFVTGLGIANAGASSFTHDALAPGSAPARSARRWCFRGLVA